MTDQNKIKARDWHLIDAKNQRVGRLSTKIAHLLMGKHKPYYVKNIDCGDYVVAVNAKDVVFSGKKEKQKIYWRHSGYPGGLRSKTAADLRTTKPEEIIKHAVVGMLPKNKLAREMVKKLYIYPTSEHPYADKIKNQNES